MLNLGASGNTRSLALFPAYSDYYTHYSEYYTQYGGSGKKKFLLPIWD